MTSCPLNGAYRPSRVAREFTISSSACCHIGSTRQIMLAKPSSSHFSIPAACTARVAVPQTALASIAAIAVTTWITSEGIAAAFSMPGPERFFRGCSDVLHRSCRYFVDSPEEYLPPSWPGRFLAIASTSANCAGGSSRTPRRYSIPAFWRTPASTTTKPPKGEDERQRNVFAGPT